MYLTGSIASIVPPKVINTFFPLSELEVKRSAACFAMSKGSASLPSPISPQACSPKPGSIKTMSRLSKIFKLS